MKRPLWLVITAVIIVSAILLIIWIFWIDGDEDGWPDDILVDVTPIDNVEWTDGVIYQLNHSEPGKVKLEVEVVDMDGNPVENVKVDVTGPGFTIKTNTTNAKGFTVFELMFTLPTVGNEFITIKASGGTSGLGGSCITEIPVAFKAS
jgi:hypothetical protein